MNALNRLLGVMLWFSVLMQYGCFYLGKNDFGDVVQQSSEEWSTRDCLTVILGVMQHNFNDLGSPSVKVVALPYYPSVIAAIERRAHILGPLQYQPFTYAHTKEMYRHRLDSALALEAGIYMDWSVGRYVDNRGNYLREPTQLDLLMFYVSLRNPDWPGVPPDAVPDITNLESNVYLANDQDKFIKPRFVWGKMHT